MIEKKRLMKVYISVFGFFGAFRLEDKLASWLRVSAPGLTGRRARGERSSGDAGQGRQGCGTHLRGRDANG